MMKIIWFKGNLGNQIFQCSFVKKIKFECPNSKIYGYYDTQCPIYVNRYFDFDLPPSKWYITILSFMVFRVLGVLIRRMPVKYIPRFYCLNSPTTYKSIFFDGFWQDKTFYEKFSKNWVKFRNIYNIGEKNQDICKIINENLTVSLHVRRGDYIENNTVYVDLLKTNYYIKAIELVKKKYCNPIFLVFSDDISYVKKVIKEPDMVFIDWNKGERSFLDIYLMTLVDVNIIANSTFSYWGAYMNHKSKLKIYPNEWYKLESKYNYPDIIPNNWVGL